MTQSSKVGLLFDEELGLQPTTSSNSSADEEARLCDLCVKIKKQAYMHKLAGYHYESRYFLVGFLPSVILTLACAILSLFTETQSRVTGMLATLAVFSQALTKHLNQKNNQAQVHHYAANAMQKISEDVTRLQASVQPLHNDAMRIDKSLLFLERKKSAHDRFEQARDGIDSNIPIEITAAFGLLESKLYHTQVPNGECARFNVGYELLFNVFCNTWLWRLKLPSSRWAVRQVLRELKATGHIGDDSPVNQLPNEARTSNEEEAPIFATFSNAPSDLSAVEQHNTSSAKVGNAQLSTSTGSNADLSSVLNDILCDEKPTVNNERKESLPVIHPSRKLSKDHGSEEVVSTPASMSKSRIIDNEVHDNPVVTAVVAAVKTVASSQVNSVDYETDDNDVLLNEILATDKKEVSSHISTSMNSVESSGGNGSPIVKRLTDFINASKSWTNKAGVESNIGQQNPPRQPVSPKTATSSVDTREQQTLTPSSIFRRTTPPRPPKAPTSAVSKKKVSEDEWKVLQNSSLCKSPERKREACGNLDIFDSERRAAPATPSSIFLSDNGQSCSVSEISVSRSLDQNVDIVTTTESGGSKAYDHDSQSSKIYSRSLEAQLNSLIDNDSSGEESQTQKQNMSSSRVLAALLDSSEKTMIFTRQRSSSSGCISSSTSLSKGENKQRLLDEERSRDQTPEVFHKFQQEENFNIQLKASTAERKENRTFSALSKQDNQLSSIQRHPRGQLKSVITNSPRSSIDGDIIVQSGTSFVSSLECPSWCAPDEDVVSKVATKTPSSPSAKTITSDPSSLPSATGVLSPIVAKAKNIQVVLANLRLRRQSNREVEDYKELNSVYETTLSNN